MGGVVAGPAGAALGGAAGGGVGYMLDVAWIIFNFPEALNISTRDVKLYIRTNSTESKKQDSKLSKISLNS